MNVAEGDSLLAVRIAMLEEAVACLQSSRADAAMLDLLLKDNVRRREAEMRLQEVQEWVQLAQEAGGVAAYTFDFVRGELNWSPSTFALYGWPLDRRPSVPNWLASIHPQDLDAVQHVASAALEAGEDVDHQFRIIRGDGTERWLRDRARIVRDATGKPLRLVGMNVDITDVVHAQANAEYVAKETSHRLRNLLSVVQSLVTGSLAKLPATGSISTDINERIAALGRSQSILLDNVNSDVELMDIIRSQVEPVAGEAFNRVTLSGPPTIVRADVVQALGLALYEMTTNACKHGAFSLPEGRLAISWRFDQAHFIFEWIETANLSISDKQLMRCGYGQELTGRVLERSLKAEVAKTLHPNGLTWSFKAARGVSFNLPDET